MTSDFNKPQSPDPLSNSGGTIHILLVEDSATNQQMIRTHLEQKGHRVTPAQNGREAVEAFKKERFNLILMDVQMPVMDGFATTRVIRALEKAGPVAGHIASDQTPAAPVPIIAMTAYTSKSDQEMCLAYGMNDYLSKPFKRASLLAMVEKWTYHSPDKPDLAAPDGPAPTSAPTHSGAANTPKPGLSATPLDFETAVEEFDGDRELLWKIIVGFMGNVKNQLKEMHRAVLDHDKARLALEAHSIKGGAANLTADALAKVAAELEEKAGTAETGDLQALLKKLEDEFQRLQDFMQCCGQASHA